MLVMFNIKNDNKTYRIPCLSTRLINPQHVIGVGGPLGSFVTPLTEPEATKTHEKGPRRRRRNRKDRCSGGGGCGGGGCGGGGGGGDGGGGGVAVAMAVAVEVATEMAEAMALRVKISK